MKRKLYIFIFMFLLILAFFVYIRANSALIRAN